VFQTTLTQLTYNTLARDATHIEPISLRVAAVDPPLGGRDKAKVDEGNEWPEPPVRFHGVHVVLLELCLELAFAFAFCELFRVE